jgi:hypothetical protein
MSDLTPEEQKFFETGGAAGLTDGTEQPAPEPVAVAPEPAPAPPPDKFEEIKSNLNSALKQSREEKKALEEKLGKMEETFQQFLARANAKPEPKFEDDPLGYTQNKLTAVETKLNKFETQAQQQGEFDQLARAIQASEETVRKANPQYDQAIAHLKKTRFEDFTDLGMSSQDAQNALNQEIIALGKLALQQGKNPAQVAYQMAKRYGFKEAPAQPAAEQTIATVAKGMQASKTVQGGAAVAGVTLANLADLDDATLDAIIKDDAKWEKLIRGQTIQ